MAKSFLELIDKSLTAKIFFRFFLSILLVSVSISVISYMYQKKSTTDRLMADADTIAKLLEHDLRLGLFTENSDELKKAGRPFLGLKGVRAISIFSATGGLLQIVVEEGASRAATTAIDKDILFKLRSYGQSVFIYRGDGIKIFFPVRSNPQFNDDHLFFDTNSSPERPYLGFVAVDIDKRVLYSQFSVLLLDSTIIGLLILVFSSLATYPTVKKIMIPLKELTRGVEELRKGADPIPIPVLTRDEVGKLAYAFNKMSDELKESDRERQRIEKQLRQSQKLEAIGRLTGGIAHDFNNIITAILGHASRLDTYIAEDSPAMNHVCQIELCANKAAALTGNLLTFSRFRKTKKQPVNLISVVNGIRDLLSSVVGETTTLITDFDDKEMRIYANARGTIKKCVNR